MLIIKKEELENNAPPSGQIDTPPEPKPLTQLPVEKEDTPPSPDLLSTYPKKRTFTELLRPVIIRKKKKIGSNKGKIIPQTQEQESGDADDEISKDLLE